jgi:DNA-binding IclR family transcriptional regulator
MKTVEKALKILEVFLEKGGEIGISELVNITGQNISTVHAILMDLVKGGYVQQNYKRGKYSLGLKFISFSDNINKITTLKELVYPFMVDLNRQTDETITTLILNRNTTMSVTGINSGQNLRVVFEEKIGVPLYCTGAGKLFLAGMTEDKLNDYFKCTELEAFTPKTITDINKLRRQIQKIRRDGIAYDFDEYQIGVRNIAVPVKSYNGDTLAVISLIAPSVRLSWKRIKEIEPLLKKSSLEIERLMGNRDNNNSSAKV